MWFHHNKLYTDNQPKQILQWLKKMKSTLCGSGTDKEYILMDNTGHFLSLFGWKTVLTLFTAFHVIMLLEVKATQHLGIVDINRGKKLNLSHLRYHNTI